MALVAELTQRLTVNFTLGCNRSLWEIWECKGQSEQIPQIELVPSDEYLYPLSCSVNKGLVVYLQADDTSQLLRRWDLPKTLNHSKKLSSFSTLQRSLEAEEVFLCLSRLEEGWCICFSFFFFLMKNSRNLTVWKSKPNQMINFRLFLGKFPLMSRLCCYLYLEKTWKTSAVSFWEWAKETYRFKKFSAISSWEADFQG